MKYQLKMEGMPTIDYGKQGDDWSNETLKTLGRTWENLGYVIFQCETADGEGNITADFGVDYSWHVCGDPEKGPITLPKGTYKVNFCVTEAPSLWRTVFLSEDPLEFVVADVCEWGGSRVDIGDETSEAGHNLSGWGPIEPAASGGNWGLTGPTGQVDNCRVIWDISDDAPSATLTLTNIEPAGDPLLLHMRHLDGIADDSFDVYVNGNLVGHYTDWQAGDGEEPIDQETWMNSIFDLSGEGIAAGVPVNIQLTATGTKWSDFNTFGQVGFDWIELVDDPAGDSNVVTVTATICEDVVGCSVSPNTIDFGYVTAGACNVPVGADDIVITNTSTANPPDCKSATNINVSAAVTGDVLEGGLKHGGCSSSTGTVHGWSQLNVSTTTTIWDVVYDVPSDASGDIGGTVTITCVASP